MGASKSELARRMREECPQMTGREIADAVGISPAGVSMAIKRGGPEGPKAPPFRPVWARVSAPTLRLLEEARAPGEATSAVVRRVLEAWAEEVRVAGL